MSIGLSKQVWRELSGKLPIGVADHVRLEVVPLKIEHTSIEEILDKVENIDDYVNKIEKQEKEIIKRLTREEREIISRNHKEFKRLCLLRKRKRGRKVVETLNLLELTKACLDGRLVIDKRCALFVPLKYTKGERRERYLEQEEIMMDNERE